jgi:anthranilate synthase/aminodeoxychorismate synthase-like glutamine amidotransferase
MIVLLDNYDSFVHNLARYVRELGGEPHVLRNDAASVEDIAALAPTHIIISPGPCTPAESGISVELIRRLGAGIPMLGVCLGHQAIGAAYGARVVRAGRPMHGRTSAIIHDQSGVLRGLPNPFRATRYHSLALERDTLPQELVVNATSDDGEIMAVRHAEHPVHGVQFHPESVLTEHGHAIVRRFLETKR